MAKNADHPSLQPLKAAFSGTRFLVGEFRDMVTVVVPREDILPVCLFLRDDARTKFNFLCEINGVDYLGYPGAEHRFAVNYGLTSHANNNRLWLKVFFDPTLDTAPGTAPRDEEALTKGDPALIVDSVASVWAGAEWMEREVYDMIGIIFKGNADLRRILTWNGFGSYPLRKDYPLRGVGEREQYKIITREGAQGIDSPDGESVIGAEGGVAVVSLDSESLDRDKLKRRRNGKPTRQLNPVASTAPPAAPSAPAGGN